jgi:N-methylhydantoinase B
MNAPAHVSQIDPVLTAILANRMDSIVREMMNTVLRTARSAVINSARDFSCAIVTADNQLFACAEGLPIHIFGTDEQARTMARYHPDLAEGDCYLHNDPYTGNTHAADHTFLVPVFFEGEHMFTAVAKAHQADIGNSLPTCYMPTARDVYEEGALIFPAVQIQRDYQMIEDVVRMAQKRIRVPTQWYGDFLAGISAARIGERRLKEFCTKYGKATVKKFMKDWLDYSELLMIRSIEKLPAAKLENNGRHDPVPPLLPDGIPVNVKISIDPQAAKIEVDLRDNVDNFECGYNLSEACSVSAVLAGIFNNLEGDVPRNAGSFRRVNVLMREGAVVGKPEFPYCCSVATTNVADRVVNTTSAAFAALGEGFGLAEGAVGLGLGMAVVSGADHRHDDAPYVNQLHLSANGGPASAKADGWVTYGIPIISGLMFRDSVEIDELKHPFQIRRLALKTGSGGAGTYRGAPGAVVEFGPKKNPITVIYPGDGQVVAPRGVRGGRDGQLAERWLVRADGSEERLTNAAQVQMGLGEYVRGMDCSGGGYGSPMKRDPRRVLHDVLERYETVERGEEIYGVVLTGSAPANTLAVDVEATKARRKAAVDT